LAKPEVNDLVSSRLSFEQIENRIKSGDDIESSIKALARYEWIGPFRG